QPAPTPGAPGSPSTKAEVSSSANEAGNSQNEMLFMRGNAMSGAPIISGTIQLPNPPISAGITMKKIMIRPCAVVNTLNWWASWNTCRPGTCNSMRIATDIEAPITPAQIAHTVDRGILLLRLFEPGGVVLFADHANGDRHVGMVLAAQFRALAVVHALAGRLEPGLV